MKAAEIRELTVAEIEERIDAEKNNLLRMKLNHAVSPVENPTTIKKTRRDIARMMTILAEKKNVKS
ncbi:MAG TPA: 50S ribosomal protein L29 [Candidatus Alistipes merdigallinarum]|nr:50S ribosomal protein L29 [Candidatus Alistipes merdigallinarum]